MTTICAGNASFGPVPKVSSRALPGRDREADVARRVSDLTNTVDGEARSPHAPQRADARRPWSIVNDPVDQLTEGQRDCLRLVYGHMTSKDIARALDISPHTVDMRLRTAMKVLGVASRIEAARALYESEAQSGTYQPLIYQAPDVAGHDYTRANGVPASAPSEDHASQQSDTRFSPEFGPPAGGPPRPAGASSPYALDHAYDSPLSRSLPWGHRNTLSPGARLAWIAIIAIGSALGFGAILGALEALKNLL